MPDNYFSRQGLEVKRLASLIDSIENIDTLANECDLTEEDLVGQVYEYFPAGVGNFTHFPSVAESASQRSLYRTDGHLRFARPVFKRCRSMV